jgi:DNA helicase-2/ATP-dependent DNA helicase PcrA
MDYLEALNPRQREAVLHFGSPLLILAGAGSGKTRVVTTKIAYLVDRRGLDPASILAVAFTNKAAGEMKQRARALAPGAEAVMIKTFHAFGAWLLRRHVHLLNLPGGFNICDEEDSRSVLRNMLGKKLSALEARDLAQCISRAKDRCLEPGDDLSGLKAPGILAGYDFSQIYADYQVRLRESGNVDFGDLILQSVRLLTDFPEVADRLRQRFRVILVDEYQDSNHAQFRLLASLYGETSYLCVVGDEDQSIYGFRGAEVNNILEFPDAFPGTRVIRLEQNYRSTGNVLRVASQVVANNRLRLGKTLWTEKPAGPPVVFRLLEDQDLEAEYCASLLSDRDYANTAILYRMNFQSRVFENLFARRGIPFRVVGTVRFYEREEVKDARAYLALLANPRDEIAFRRAVGKPRRGIGKVTVDKLIARRREGGDLLAACRSLAAEGRRNTAAALGDFVRVMDSLEEKLERSAGGSLEPLVRQLLEESGLYAHYQERDEIEGGAKARNLEELVNATRDYPGGREGLVLFLESVELEPGRENPFAPEGKVTLITVHNTKGLEFDRVIITGLEDEIFPHHRSLVEGLPVAGTDLEEERRLFYVGITRARKRLYLTAARRRRVFGTFKKSEPSQFLKEIPPECLHDPGGVPAWGGGSLSEADGSPARGGNSPSEADGFPLGCGVYHDDYGPGRIIRRYSAEGLACALVRFDSGKTARFILKYASLERISVDD